MRKVEYVVLAALAIVIGTAAYLHLRPVLPEPVTPASGPAVPVMPPKPKPKPPR